MPSHAIESRSYESGLAALVAVTIAVILGSAWWDARQDREVTLDEAAHLAETLASAASGRFDATFRDAANAALSAAMLVHEKGGFAALGDETTLARELKRESWEETSTARLVALSPEGAVLAASSGRVPADTRLPAPGKGTEVRGAGRAPMRLGATEVSRFDRQWVVPLWVAVDPAGSEREGWIRAEVRSDYLEQFLERLPGSALGSLVIMTVDGVVLVRAPHDESLIGRSRPGVIEFLRRATGEHGTMEYTPLIDNQPRVYAWRRLAEYPVVVAVGLQKERVLAQWQWRMAKRTAASVLLCCAMVALGLGFAIHMRRVGQAREQAREFEHRYWEAMTASSSGIAIADLEGRWLQVNPALCAMLGRGPEELLALPTPAVCTDAARRVQGADASQGDDEAPDQALVHRDGHPVWVDVQCTVLRDRAGQPRNLAFHFEDVTARKLAEDALRELNGSLERTVAARTQELQLANEDLEAFTYSVAHDLRGPVDRLGQFVDVLEREAPPDEKLRRRLEAIRRQGRNMGAMIDDLLAFSRAGKAQMRVQKVDMDEVVQQVRSEAGPQLAGRQVEWHVHPLPGTVGDRALLREVWSNLVGNAIKYTGRRDVARIEIGTFDAGESETGYFIQDNGAGFDEAFAEQLFAPFKRLHTESEFPGTGVGLAIVHRILLRHGGRVWGRGKVGEGAAFHFTLPAVKTA